MPFCSSETIFATNEEIHRKLQKEAEENGLLLVGFSEKENLHYRKYKFNACGHVQDIRTDSVRIGNFRCRTCLEEKLKRDASEAGLVLLDKRSEKSRSYRWYILPCGHEAEVSVAYVKPSKKYLCPICLGNKLNKEAELLGLTLLRKSGPGWSREYYLYKLPCDHERNINSKDVRKGLFKCDVCSEYSWTSPSKTYVYRLTVGSFSWIKVGHASNLERRVRGYRLAKCVEVKLLFVEDHNTRFEAQSHEARLLKAASCFKIDSNLIKSYMKSGSTECFNTDAESVLSQFFQ